MSQATASLSATERALDALGNPTRRSILRILGGGARPVGDIAAKMTISRPAVSKHLRVLEDASLVAFDTVGNRNIFRLDPRGFDAARSWLEPFWADALGRFAEVAEKTAARKKKPR